ncbi:MAG: TIGR03756 family integrating conjugative element protein [Gammaproteobacteria bacterium]|nr:TIGR03756 family integrating conjugative element protein [Gammaproteobacteria bacterium]
MHALRSAFLVVLILFAPFGEAESLSTAQIVQRTLHSISSCLDWRWVGNCFWSQCDLLGCEVSSSMKVRHYLPDLLVTVQRVPTDTPWTEMRHALSSTQSATTSSVFRPLSRQQFVGSGADVAVSSGHERNGDVRFFEASVFGHPLEALPLEVERLLCRSSIQAGKPYYQSSLDDFAWRFAPLESIHPAALIPGRREIGRTEEATWGAVYPRSGFVTQQSPVKAAAVIAQRACDILIGPRGQHVALELENPKPYTSVPTHLDERDAATGLWQMISPFVDPTCDLFGTQNPNWDFGRIDESRAFIWNLWRPYECCEPRGSIYLGAVHF